jgi:crotonobetainyl-CoA:carnitine CoA-transferase CaiB-like acyl-CoA transferase
MAGPLVGVRILDLSSVVSGPLATMHLADQGADVIKIEPPGGDISRRSRRKISANGEFSALFVSINRGKRSIAIDLKRPEAIAIVRALVARTDVLVQNFRPGTMERLGLDEKTLRELNPKLIYVSISGVGDSGPYVKKRIYDPMIQALSGLADIQSNQETQRPQMIRTIVADMTTSIFAAQAITAALFAREKTGEGQHIRISLLDTMISYLWPEGMMQHTVPSLESLPMSTNAGPDLIFETMDGYITVGTITDSEWRGFCEAVERPDLIYDERFHTAERRSVNSIDRINLMAGILKHRSRADWLSKLDAADVPCAPVLRRDELMANEQVVANDLLKLIEQPSVGAIRQPRPAAQFDRTPAEIGGPAPGIGEHTENILAELGYRDVEIKRLKEIRVAAAARTAGTGIDDAASSSQIGTA